MVREILKLGDERLYQVSEPVAEEELPAMRLVAADLHDTLLDFRARWNCGRAIAAPQIGVRKRLLYLCIDEPVVFCNPTLEFPSQEKMTLLDDCMSFPGLLVRVERFRQCVIHYRDLEWKPCSMELSGDLSELLQHEYDHLDGILAVMRAVDERSFYYKL